MGKLFDELKQLKKEYDEKLRREGEAAVKDAFKDVFEKFPELRSIQWTQYTPYWNDGDVCHFSVHEFDISVGTDEQGLKAQIEDKKAQQKLAADRGAWKTAQNLQDDIDELEALLAGGGEDYSYGESIYSLKKDKDPRTQEMVKAVIALQRELPDDVLEDVFGDHVSVVATREGFKVKEYEHE